MPMMSKIHGVYEERVHQQHLYYTGVPFGIS